MQKCLFLLCPTDCLETVINHSFHYDNYFYTSLGNSYIYNRENIKHIRKLVKKHRIKEIYFVLCYDNQIILDASGNQDFSNIRKLNSFYRDITKRTNHLSLMWQSNNLNFSIISYYLNFKIKLLKTELSKWLDYPVKIRGKIYSRKDKAFMAIHSDLICIEKHHLN